MQYQQAFSHIGIPDTNTQDIGLYLYLTSIYSVLWPPTARCLTTLTARLTHEGIALKRAGALPGGVNGPRGEAMVSKLWKRLAGRSASTSADKETQGWQVQGLERRDPSGPAGNPLPSAWVRMYVWRRDHGRCVRCGGQERVWFEYIVPVWAGGSNKEPNIRLMCARCSHDRGASTRRKRLRF